MNLSRSATAQAGLALGLVLLVGCGSGGSTAGSSTPGSSAGGSAAPATGGVETHVSLWSWRTDDKVAMGEIFGQFEKDNPGIKVDLNLIPDADYQNTLGVALRGGKGPDVAQLKAYGELQPLVDAGYLTRLNDLVPELGELSSVALEGAKAKKDGGYYGVPYSVVNMGVYYNTEVFEKNKVAIPKTYDEFVKACQTFKAAGVVPIAAGGANGTGWALEINTGVIGPSVYGPGFYKDMMSGSAKFTDPKWVQVLQTVKDLAPYYEDGFAGTDYTSAVQQFVTGKAAMFFGGSFENGSFKAQNKDLKFSMFPFPPKAAGQPAFTSSFSDGSYGVVSTTKQQDAAVKLVRFIGSKEFAQLFADKLGWPPARTGITPSDPVLKVMTDMQKNSEPYITLVGFRWQQPTASSILQTGIVDMVAGKKSPGDLAREMDTGVSTWFKPMG